MSEKSITVGNVRIGAGAQVSVQSMTNTDTSDVDATVGQIGRLAAAGCDIVRVAVPDIKAAEAIARIKERIAVPLVADIHFDHKLALRAVEAGADKIRINPGNIGAVGNVRAVAAACAGKGIPIRIGVNSGSISKEILAKHGKATPEAMLESALENVSLLNRFDFDDICISVKSSSVAVTIAANKLLSEQTRYPLHLGVTEAGTEHAGLVKSAIGIGSLLSEGIGDTIRVSLTAPPEAEVKAGLAILRALSLRRGYELVSCPTCGRCSIELTQLAAEVERRLEAHGKYIKVAVMGCAVNGPGEAAAADYGIAGGKNEGILFKKGKVLKKAPAGRLVDELFALIEADGQQGEDQGT